MQPRDAPKVECFLCHPNGDWIWAESEHYFAMSALGPIVEGMSIVACGVQAQDFGAAWSEDRATDRVRLCG